MLCVTEPETEEHARLISIVQRIMDGDYTDDAEVFDLLGQVARAVPCTSGHLSDLIFWPKEPELTARHVIERALAYRPIAL